MFEEIYQRQSNVGLKIPNSILVIGCGGVGAWVSIFFAMVGVKNITLIDHDSIEVHNLNRLPFTIESVGKPKVEVLKDFIKTIRPSTSIISLNTRFEEIEEVLPPMYDVVIECTDNVKTQNIVRKWCRRNGVKLVEAHYDFNPELNDWTITVTYFKDPSKIPDAWAVDEEITGYTITPSYVVPAVLVASIVVHVVVKELDQINISSRSINEVLLKNSL